MRKLQYGVLRVTVAPLPIDGRRSYAPSMHEGYESYENEERKRDGFIAVGIDFRC